MSSIRPLATITVLALVGTFLYMKINETEPVLPEGVDSWSMEQDIQIGGDFGTAAETNSFETAAPPSAPSTSQAPVFNAESTTAPAFNPSAQSEAPAFDPNANTQPIADAPQAQGSSSMASLPELPPLPSMPATANSTVPNVDTPAMMQQNLIPPVNTPTDQAPAMTATIPTTEPTGPADGAPAQSSLFAATRLAAQAALDRGELSQALLLLSDWYGDPSLSPSEANEVQTLLGQLAGSVIYSTEPRLEAPYMVQAGETLESIAQKYDVPWQLLAKINGITNSNQLSVGQQIKVLRGPFSAVIDLSKRKLTLMLDRRYAGEFSIEYDPTISVEEGHWSVNQKLLTPAATSFGAASPTTPSEERSLTLTTENGGSTQLAIIRAAGKNALPAEPTSRVIRLKQGDVEDVFDILSLGSKVVIRR